MAKVPRIIKVPAGEAYIVTENPLGQMGYYLVSRGDLGPFRLKIRSASFNNISIAPWVPQGVSVPDIIAIISSLYLRSEERRLGEECFSTGRIRWSQLQKKKNKT